MITLADYANRDATELAACVARGEMHPAELVDAALRAVQAVNPQVNAVIRTVPELAQISLELALPSGAPFAGVPFAIKELTISARSVPIDMGSRLTRGYTPNADSELMSRFRRAGLILIGTTQTPEFGYNPSTETVLHGPVRNPWDMARSAGGSSGGSGAAVAAGIVPLAHANDGGGSIRIPACCNGLVGLKPTRDRIPTGPNSADPLFGLAIDFAVARSLRDCAALFDAVHGPDAGAPSVAVPPARPFLQELGAPPGKLRIAYATRPTSGDAVDPECVRAVERTVAQLAALGHEIVEDAPEFDWERFLTSVHVLWCVATAFAIDRAGMAMRRKPSPENLEATTWACFEDGKRFSAMELAAAQAHHNTISRAVAPFFARYDAFITPTLAQLAAPLGQLDQNRAGLSAMGWTRQVFAYCPFTPLYNTTGQPALSLPLHWTEAGLPVGVQLVGRFGDEAGLFRLASQLEQAMPWQHRRPAVFAGDLA